MMPARKLALAAVLLAAATVAIAVATRTDASERGVLSRISNTGSVLQIKRGAIPRPLGVRQAHLLAVRRGRAFYRLESAAGACIAAGPAASPGQIGSIECPRGPFPTTARPVIDLSVYEVTSRATREATLYRAEGVAADGVAAIAFLRPDGSVALQVPVSGNVFAAGSVPSGPIAGLAAFDSAGRQLWRSP